MPKLDLDLMEETRRSICGNCEHYNRKKDACQFIALKTGKLGLLKHHNGVRNPKSRCPYFYDRRWNFIPSFFPWEINRIVMPLTPHEVYEFTKARYLSPFQILEKTYLKADKTPGEPLPKRSLIVSRVRQINSRPNEYQHLEYLQVNYSTGSVYE